MPIVFYLFVVTFTLFLTLIMVTVNIKDIPSERSSHIVSTPRGGGIAIMTSIFISIGLLFLFQPVSLFPLSLSVMLLGGFSMGLMGLWDDIKNPHFLPRLSIQILCAISCVYSGMSIQHLSFPFLGVLPLGFFSPIVTCLWILGFTNAFNFYDGLNGLASGTALLALCILGNLLPSDSLPFYGFLWRIFACAIFGFLVFNFPFFSRLPTLIFLGDSGSQFIGFSLACFPLVINQGIKENLSIYTMPLLFFAPLWDIILTLIRRLFRGENITQPHKKHFFQLLQRSGWSHQHVSFLYYGFTVLQGIGAFYLQKIPLNEQWKIFIPYVFLYIYYSWWVLKRAEKQRILS